MRDTHTYIVYVSLKTLSKPITIKSMSKSYMRMICFILTKPFYDRFVQHFIFSFCQKPLNLAIRING